MLKVPGTKRLQLNHDKPISSFAFNFNLRRYIEVGSYYKAPSYPVWVVCCESHFTCIFAVDGRAAARGKFPTDVYYYDGLANQVGRCSIKTRVDSIETCVRSACCFSA